MRPTRKNILYHVAGWASFFLYWIVYSYFNNGNFRLSIAIAFSDTLNYAIGTYLITAVFINSFLYNRRFTLFLCLFVLTSCVIAVSRIACYYLVGLYFNKQFPVGLSSSIYHFTTTFFILSAATGARFALDNLESKKRIEEIEKEKATSELNFLKNQLNPHFLFNTLNTVFGTIDLHNVNARNMVIKLSDMLRYQLYECNVDRILLDKEIGYLKNYVDLQKPRFNDMTVINFAVDITKENLQVAPLILAPIVENTFKHVSRFGAQQNRIAINICFKENVLTLETKNTYDSQVGESNLQGVGINNVKRRLELLYPGKFELSVDKDELIYSVKLKITLL